MTSTEPTTALLAALAFAADRHRAHRRKGADQAPYVNHLIAVAELLARVGGVTDPVTLQAAVLHDTVEDVGVTPAELVERFGPEVAGVVAEVTDDKALPRAERKRLQVEHAPRLSAAARLVKLADKISNVGDVAAAPPHWWDPTRRAAYLGWAESVVAGLRGANPALDAEFDRVLAEGRARLAGEAAGGVAGAGAAAPAAALGVLGTLGALAAALLAAPPARAQPQPTIGLITKTATNPFFVKMREGAEAAARARGFRLLTAAGKSDGDNAGQVTALENMVAAGARVVLLTASDARAIVPAVRRARARGVVVVALDSPTDPADAVDALYATDNYEAGLLIGRYARAALGGRAPRAVTLDLLPGHPVGAQRHNGFLAGLGGQSLPAASTQLARPAALLCSGDTFGDAARAQTVMENCLQRAPDANVVYAINEPAGGGAHRALAAAGRANSVVLVAVDGSCRGVRDVASGALAATAQQYPVRMAELGVAAAADYIRTGKKPTGYTNTGVALIAGRALPGVPSRDARAGAAACFGR